MEKRRRKPGLLPQEVKQQQQQAAARLHAVRLRMLNGGQPSNSEYDSASGQLRSLPGGDFLDGLVMSATCRWPSERNYQSEGYGLEEEGQ